MIRKFLLLLFSVALLWYCKPPWTGTSTFLRVAALTFDDGPSPYTGKILDLLRAAGIHATFFVLGENAARFPELAKRMVDEGNEVENHSYSHPHLVFHRFGFIRDEIQKTNEIILRTTGKSPRYFRPPYGQYHLGIMKIAADFGLITTLWSDTGYDWLRPGTAQIVENVMRNLKPGAIILLHDGGGDRKQTVEALREILLEAKLAGYRFVRLDELF